MLKNTAAQRVGKDKKNRLKLPEGGFYEKD